MTASPPRTVPLEAIELFVDGLDHPEGVCVTPAGELFAGGEAGQLYAIDEDGSFRVVTTTGGFLLGLAADGAGRIYACDVVHHCVWRIEPASGARTIVLNGIPDRPVRVPNVPVFDRGGNLYVTDSGTWDAQDGLIWVVRPGGGVAAWTETAAGFPNGAALSADGGALIVVEGAPPRVSAIPIEPDGEAGTPLVLVELPGMVPDGVAVADDGTILVCCYRPDTILAWHPDRGLSTLAADPGGTLLAAPTNAVFVGPERSRLVVANLGRWHLARFDTGLRGAELAFPAADLLGS